MKKRLLIGAFLLLGMGIFAKVLSNAGWDSILATMSQMSWGQFAVFLGITQISFALFTLRWQIILKTQGYQVSYAKLWLYRASGYGVSYITPTQVGGEPVRIHLLNHNHQISLREGTASVLLDKLLELSTFVIFISGGLLMVSFTDVIPKSSLYPMVALVGGLICFAIYVIKKLFDGSGFLTSTFQRMGLNRFKRLQPFEAKIFRTEKLIMDFLSHSEHQKTTMPLISVISMLAWMATFLEYAYLAFCFGISLSLYETVLVSTLPLTAYLIPVPGGLGMLEGAQAGLFSILGYSSGVALAVVMMVRLKEIVFSCIGFAYAMTHGFTLLGKEKKADEHQHLHELSSQRSLNTARERSFQNDAQEVAEVERITV